MAYILTSWMYENGLPECDTVWYRKQAQTFQRNSVPSSSGEEIAVLTFITIRPSQPKRHLSAGWLLAWLSLRPINWKYYVPPKRRWKSTGLHGATSRNITFTYIQTDVRTHFQASELHMKTYLHACTHTHIHHVARYQWREPIRKEPCCVRRTKVRSFICAINNWT